SPIHDLFRHVEPGILERTQCRDVPASNGEIGFKSSVKVSPAAGFAWVFRRDPYRVSEGERSLNSLAHAYCTVTDGHSVHFTEHQQRDRVIVSIRVIECRFGIIGSVANQAARFLARDREVDRAVQGLAIGPQSRAMPPREKGHDGKGSQCRLTV